VSIRRVLASGWPRKEAGPVSAIMAPILRVWAAIMGAEQNKAAVPTAHRAVSTLLKKFFMDFLSVLFSIFVIIQISAGSDGIDLFAV
jgi:hypothetical protein